ncbi:3-phosphoshikimate 1-carboxyvinyltransferase [Lachnobacterium bovis]|uniref:3-phosphoshikimate 1-carboxyvinyltransferase n=1 Tax=Lachnobacterium bovis TaxID=140626 RepID=UPI000A79C90A|nr:3-phosphoshikimate 1-carboxyvinyltransferase [Lachnobacterium bovis]
MKMMNEYRVKKLNRKSPIVVEVPGSKSITNRALLLAAMTNTTCRVNGILFSDDSRHFLKALCDLGFNVLVDEKNKTVSIEGKGGIIPKQKATIDVGSAGTAARFLTAFCALNKGEFIINSSEQMKKRPMKELLICLEELGSNIEYLGEKYHFPIKICNKHMQNLKDEITVNVNKSSQFLSALLISSVILKKDFKIKIDGTHGMAYVRMTIEMMKQFGVEVKQLEERVYVIKKDSVYSCSSYQVEPDVSAACYFYALGAICSIKVKVKNVKKESLQGDIKFLEVLEDMGCNVLEDENGEIIIISPLENRVNLKGGTWDLSSFSDQALTLSAIAVYADSNVCIKNIGHIRFQECDRVNAIISNLEKVNVKTEIIKKEDDNLDLVIYPVDDFDKMLVERKKINVIETYEDHRVAMAFSLLGIRNAKIIIENPLCCRKTFENYFDVLDGLY